MFTKKKSVNTFRFYKISQLFLLHHPIICMHHFQYHICPYLFLNFFFLLLSHPNIEKMRIKKKKNNSSFQTFLFIECSLAFWHFSSNSHNLKKSIISSTEQTLRWTERLQATDDWECELFNHWVWRCKMSPLLLARMRTSCRLLRSTTVIIFFCTVLASSAMMVHEIFEGNLFFVIFNFVCVCGRGWGFWGGGGKGNGGGLFYGYNRILKTLWHG